MTGLIPIPKIDSYWKHSSGKQYQVVMITNIASTKPEEYPVTVVYKDIEGKVWSRPLSRWTNMKEIKEKTHV